MLRCTSRSADDLCQDTSVYEFKAGLVRSMKQYNAGLVKIFYNADDFLADLHKPE
jgi:hypothetical protein